MEKHIDEMATVGRPSSSAMVEMAIDLDLELRRLLDRVVDKYRQIDAINMALIQSVHKNPDQSEEMHRVAVSNENGLMTHMVHKYHDKYYMIRFRVDTDLKPRFWLVINEIKQ